VLKNINISAATGMTIQYAQITQDRIVITPMTGDAVNRGPGVTINGK
jgi:hypothetical protein